MLDFFLRCIGERGQGANAVAPGDFTRSLLHRGTHRTYRVYVPSTYDRTKRPPLLIALHGGLGTGDRMVELTLGGFNRIAEREGPLAVYPDGVERHWNDGRKEVKYRAHREKVDDVGFISALIDELLSRYEIDRKRVYVTGISNGGLMAFRLACEIPENIAAIAPMTASLQVELGDAKPPLPVPVLIINGTADPLVPWEGGDIGPPGKRLGQVLSTMDTVRFWVRRNGCQSEPTKTILPDKEPKDGTRVIVETYAGRAAEVVLYTIEGGGHTWPSGWQYMPERAIGKTSRDVDACEAIWEFFKKHHRR